MLTSGQASKRTARTELQVWYLESLRPKLAHAATMGLAQRGAARALDRQLRDFLDVRAGSGQEAT